MKLPLLDANTIIKILILKGYTKTGQSGSHVQFKNSKGTIITIPVHPGRPVGRGLLRKILRDMEVSRDDLEEFLRKI